MQIKVLNFLGREPTGGVGSAVLNFRQGFSSNIISDYVIFCPKEDTSFNRKAKKMGAKLFLLDSLSVKNCFKIIKGVKEIFEKEHYDIVHVHSPIVGVICLKVAKRYGCRIRIVHYHSSLKAEEKRKLLRNTILYSISGKLATNYIACSLSARKCGPKSARNIKIIYNGIDCKKYKFNKSEREKIREDLNVSDRYVVGCVARISAPKNPLFIIDVFETLYELDNKYVLLIAGDGPLMEDMQLYVKNKQCASAVLLLGRRDDVPSLLSAFDVFFLPSLYEGFPVSILEAQAAGLTCVMSNTITDEVSVFEENEYIDLNENVQVWANRIDACVKNKSRERAISYLSVSESGFGISSASKKLEEYYIDLIEGIDGC